MTDRGKSDFTHEASTSTAVKATEVGISLDHPRLVHTDPSSIRTFLKRYDQYSISVIARASQLTSQTLTTEAVTPIALKYCVDVEFLESSLICGYIDGCASYADLTDSQLRSFLEERSAESQDSMTIEQLDKIVSQKLRTNMRNNNAKSRMQDLFSSYVTILSRNGLRWLIEENPKVAVYHVLSAVRPQSLQNRLTSDLSFSKYKFQKDWHAFLKHAVRLAEAFQLVDEGPRPDGGNDNGVSGGGAGKGKGKGKGRGGTANGGAGTSGGQGSDNPGGGNKKGKGSGNGIKGELPLCLWEPHRQAGVRHLLRDCPQCPPEERRALLAKRADEKSRDGPSNNTRSKTPSTTTPTQPAPIQTGRLQQQVSPYGSSSCPIIVSDGPTSHDGTGRCDDGSDESIVSPSLAQAAAIKGIGRMSSIPPVKIQVALKDSDSAATFTFSRTWLVPRVVLKLSSGHMALLNVTFLVADDETACEDLLLGLPVLRHLGIDSRTLLERQWSSLDGTDCAGITHSSGAGRLGRLIVARMQRNSNADSEKLDPERPRSDYFHTDRNTDPFPDPFLIQPEDADTADEEAHSAIKAMLARAHENGFPDEHRERLESLVWDHSEAFRTGFSSSPAKVEPLRIALNPDAKPVRVKLRNYSAEQREFMSRLVDDLMKHKLIYPNPTSPWASAPLIVPKPGPARWRFTVDLRPVNRFTVRHQFPMPILEQELTKLSNARFFANFDFVHSYWQLPLHEESQSSQSFITPDGVFSPTRVPHGTTNAVTHLQSSLTLTIPNELRHNLLLWLDDCLLHSHSIDHFLQCLQLFLSYCVSFNWKLHPAKCILFTTSVRWCGRIISADGIRHDPARLDTLLDMERPSWGGQLQQFLCAMQWLRSSIPQFQDLVAPLHDFLEKVYKHVGKRTKRAVARVSLDQIGWSVARTHAFEACKKAIADRVTLAHRDDTKRLCIYTDASDTHWSGIVTQVPLSDTSLSHLEQAHDPLAFHSGRFSETQLGWSTLEKEAYAVLASVERSHWLAACPAGFDLFTDHNNLIFIFDPMAVMPDIGQGALRKVLRWAVRMSSYNYVCIHIRGPDNIWADLITRWCIPLTIRRLVHIPPLPTAFSDFSWPSAESISSSQATYATTRPREAVLIDGLWRVSSPGPIWIPDDADDLQLRLIVIAHSGASGHRGRSTTYQALSSEFFWSTLNDDVALFVKTCIHCISTTGGETVPRPFGPARHGTTPNALLQFNLIEMCTSPSGERYILMLRDDHSGYSWLYPAESTSADTAAQAIIDWTAAFGIPHGLMSDGPSHFKNETLRLLAKGLHTPHDFTLPYCPWSNGAIERLGKELLRVARAVLSELQQRPDAWPQLVPLFQSALNNAPSPQRNNVAPITAFTGRPSSTPISTFLRVDDSVPQTLSDTQREKCLNMQALVKEMDDLHPVVEESLTKQRERMRNARHRGELANFQEGDFVLVARDDFHKGEKLCLRWRGPRRVIKCLHDYAFQVEDLRNGQLETIHGTRLKFYSDQSLDTTAILSHVLASETGMPVSRLLRLVEEDGKFFVIVRWKGLSASEDTIEPLQRVYEDVPQLLIKLLKRKNIDRAICKRACDTLGLEKEVCNDLPDH